MLECCGAPATSLDENYACCDHGYNRKECHFSFAISRVGTASNQSETNRNPEGVHWNLRSRTHRVREMFEFRRCRRGANGQIRAGWRFRGRDRIRSEEAACSCRQSRTRERYCSVESGDRCHCDYERSRLPAAHAAAVRRCCQPEIRSHYRGGGAYANNAVIVRSSGSGCLPVISREIKISIRAFDHFAKPPELPLKELLFLDNLGAAGPVEKDAMQMTRGGRVAINAQHGEE